MPHLTTLNSYPRKRKLIEFNSIYNHLFYNYTNYTFLLPTWISKKRRSVLDSPPPPPYLPPSQPPPPVPAGKLEDCKRSPSSPLLIPLSPLEPASAPPANFAPKRKKLTYEKLREAYDERLLINQVYKNDIGKVKDHLMNLQAKNSRLKQLREELYGRGGEEERERKESFASVSPRQETTTSSASVAVNDRQYAAVSTSTHVCNHVGPVQKAQDRVGLRVDTLDRPAVEIAIDLNICAEVAEQKGEQTLTQQPPVGKEHHQGVMGHTAESDHHDVEQLVDNVVQEESAMSKSVGWGQLRMWNIREQQQLGMRGVGQERARSDLSAGQKQLQSVMVGGGQERTMSVGAAGQEQVRSELTALQKHSLMQQWNLAENQSKSKWNRWRRLQLLREKQKRLVSPTATISSS